MKAKLECGIAQEFAQRGCRSWDATFGARAASRFLGPLWDLRNMSSGLRRSGWTMRRSCGMPFRGSPIFNVRGKSLSNARDFVATISCRQCPPSQSEVYARGHDDGMMSTLHTLLGGLTGTPEQRTRANMVASLPTRLGGRGLRSAVRLSIADGGGQVAHRSRSDPEISGNRRPRRVFGRVASSRANAGPPRFRRYQRANS